MVPSPKFLCLILSLVVIVIIPNVLTSEEPSSNQSNNSQKCTCHMTELDDCVKPIREMFTKLSGSMEPGAEFDFICQKLGEAKACRNKYYDKCSAPAMKDALNSMLFQSVDKAADSFCKNDRNNYIKNARCLYESKAMTQTCATAMSSQKSLVNVKLMNLHCCILMKAHNCSLQTIEKRCGKDGVDLTNNLAEAMGTQSAQKMCANLSYDPSIC
ncbi:uncharacterized protein LOC141855016 [Brevipalpus obovatus]|uniref:uncharacterized protein LOC141855016 n=1 Tax=Brevipalpus obovatus TaxID=246614 RepID=UPI003D9DF869